MLYVNSFSPIEQKLAEKLSLSEAIVQADARLIATNRSLYDMGNFADEKVLLYSFQQLEFYRHIDSFEAENAAVDHLVDFIVENKFEKIVFLSYPGAYFNSNNLFLQFKGYIEQKFISSGIPCTVLTIQAIVDTTSQLNNLHGLFYDTHEHKYIIPQKSSCIVYSVKLTHLVNIISQSVNRNVAGKFDVFDTIYDLKTFLQVYSNVGKVQRIAPLYLYFKSYLGTYASPTMLELFLMSIVPMFKFRTEKEFNLLLHQDNHGLFVTYNRQSASLISPYNHLLKSLMPAE